mmetsp:Transcript_43333/g.69745  ORF Transcript_43333/g.69745 Transcript_43333/m.69745 type:complete len:244 (-) Transcript_43333:57-788(-)
MLPPTSTTPHARAASESIATDGDDWLASAELEAPDQSEATTAAVAVAVPLPLTLTFPSPPALSSPPFLLSLLLALTVVEAEEEGGFSSPSRLTSSTRSLSPHPPTVPISSAYDGKLSLAYGQFHISGRTTSAAPLAAAAKMASRAPAMFAALSTPTASWHIATCTVAGVARDGGERLGDGTLAPYTDCTPPMCEAPSIRRVTMSRRVCSLTRRRRVTARKPSEAATAVVASIFLTVPPVPLGR